MMRTNIFILLLFLAVLGQTQEPLTSKILEQSAFRFSLNEQNEMPKKAKEKWLHWIGENQYVGLAEVHNSAQLSLFTKALLQVLEEKGFEHFVMEMGPNSAKVLQEAAGNPATVQEDLRLLNRKYGKNASSKTPIVFANKVEDAVFIKEASRLTYTFWGIDQEFAFSYEMLLDHLYDLYPQKSEAFDKAYQSAKATIRKLIFKDKYQGQSIYCWFPESEDLNHFFSFFSQAVHVKVIDDIRKSWEIYCGHINGGSNQLRADYMKKNFEDFLKKSGANVKVFLKLGGAHLTHGISPFGVDDIGKYITEKSTSNNSGFLSIRHLISYRNGKSNIGKSGWKSVTLFLELGRKDQWTVVDLRPFREMLANGEITTNKKFAFELNSYDLLLLPPDDQYPKVNY